jgi:hypothetical protein
MPLLAALATHAGRQIDRQGLSRLRWRCELRCRWPRRHLERLGNVGWNEAAA